MAPGLVEALIEAANQAPSAHNSQSWRFLVLGPEANDAHREHFHLDLAPRPGSSYCE